MSESNSKATNELTMEATMQNLHNKFQSISDQIKNVADLMTQAGMEEQQTSK
uniref:Heat shock factor binding protein 1b n=1 Tax=Salmo trutta TaxID=8032 RepID=A0A674EMB0_SALTR